jgi:hypothetical protein
MAPTRQEGIIVDEVIFVRLTSHSRAHMELIFTDGTSKSYELPVDSLSNAVKRMDVEKLDSEMREYFRPDEGPYDI